LSFNAEKKLT